MLYIKADLQHHANAPITGAVRVKAVRVKACNSVTVGFSTVLYSTETGISLLFTVGLLEKPSDLQVGWIGLVS